MPTKISRFAALAVLLLATIGFAANTPSKEKKGSNGLEVLVGADAVASPEGLRPKPGRPIHYVFKQTRQTLGDAVAGVKIPSDAVVERAVVAELAKQGFVRAEVGGPMPALLILAIVGDSNFAEPAHDELELQPYREMVNPRIIIRDNLLPADVESRPPNDLDRARFEAFMETAALRLRYQQSGRFQDKGKIQTLLGFEKVDRGLREGAMSFSAAEKIGWAAFENRLYVTLNAFDAAQFAKKVKVLLWRTTISIDGRNDLATALPRMLADAGPLFGTDAAVPAYVDDRDRRKAEVEIGDARVVPDGEAPAAGSPTKK